MDNVFHRINFYPLDSAIILVSRILIIRWIVIVLLNNPGPGGHRFDSCWEDSDFYSELPVSLTEITSFSLILLFKIG